MSFYSDRCYESVFKQLLADTKYKSPEARILSELSSHNLPWLRVFCDTSNVTAIIVTFHSYNQEHNRSLNVFDAFYCAQECVGYCMRLETNFTRLCICLSVPPC